MAQLIPGHRRHR